MILGRKEERGWNNRKAILYIRMLTSTHEKNHSFENEIIDCHNAKAIE